MVTGAQIRAARALLGWSQQTLADRAIVSLNALNRLERGDVDSRQSTILAIETALEAAGITFIFHNNMEGVALLRQPKA